MAPSDEAQAAHEEDTEAGASTPKSSTISATARSASARRSLSCARMRAASRAPASTAMAPALTWPIASTM